MIRKNNKGYYENIFEKEEIKVSNVQDLLNEEIKTELMSLKDMQIGSQEYQAAVEGIAKLTDRSIELEKIDVDTEHKKHQFNDEKRDRIIKNCLTAAGILLPSLITIWGTFKSFEFEKEGTITTIMGRGFVNKLLPKK